MKQYIIKKNHHYSNFFPKFYCTKEKFELSGNFTFTDSCRYKIDEPSCVNKLFGFCFGFGVHKNSARIGWTYNNEGNLIDLWKYIYKYGKLEKRKFHFINLNDAHDFKITVQRNVSALPRYRHYYYIEFYIDGLLFEFDKIYSNGCFMTTLGPYFGGNTKAPHNIIIEYEKLN